jgi:hypothetical protein
LGLEAQGARVRIARMGLTSSEGRGQRPGRGRAGSSRRALVAAYDRARRLLAELAAPRMRDRLGPMITRWG